MLDKQRRPEQALVSDGLMAGRLGGKDLLSVDRCPVDTYLCSPPGTAKSTFSWPLRMHK